MYSVPKCFSEALGWLTADIILTQLAASRNTSFWVTTGIPLALLLLIKPLLLLNISWWWYLFPDGLEQQEWRSWLRLGGVSLGIGAAECQLYCLGLVREMGSVGSRAPVKPPLWSQLWANNSSDAPDIEAAGLTSHRNSTVCRDSDIETHKFNHPVEE